METITITSKREISLDDIHAALAKRWQVESAEGGRLVIEVGNSRVYFCIDVSGHEDEKRWTLSLDYFDVDLVKQVISLVGDSPELSIDNDFGTVLSGDKFVGRIESDPEWNWRN